MIAFLAVTTVINIALGYALAVYLGRANMKVAAAPALPANPATVGVLPTRRLANQDAPNEAPAMSAPAAPVAPQIKAELPELVAKQPVATEVESAPVAEQQPVFTAPVDAVAAQLAAQLPGEEPLAEDTATAGEPLDSEAALPPAAQGVEQDLLAGIEEFRSQLAQLKGGPAEVPPARVAAAATA